MTGLAAIEDKMAGLEGEDLLRPLITDLFAGQIALVSSFGAESAVLAHMVARIDPATPVLFMDTQRLFPETIDYRNKLIDHLKLRDVRSYGPNEDDIALKDPDGTLFATNPDACCAFRKVAPLADALQGFAAWISGRKRFQNSQRADIPILELVDQRFKINPLATWTPDDLSAYFKRHNLPPHPLTAQGYPSIGCVPCTSRVLPGEDMRAGRWRGGAKTECGIHARTPVTKTNREVTRTNRDEVQE